MRLVPALEILRKLTALTPKFYDLKPSAEFSHYSVSIVVYFVVNSIRLLGWPVCLFSASRPTPTHYKVITYLCLS